MKTAHIYSKTSVFEKQLKGYQTVIDDDIAAYSREAKVSTLSKYGPHARLTTDTFLDILERGGKRIRGVLVCIGYEMSGGQDVHMILQAARAIEMLHAYILIIDDIQDRSQMRRGGPSAHAQLAHYHRMNKLKGDSEHFGVALALNAALGGAHAAQKILAGLVTNEENRLKALNIINLTMLVTAHGQTLDLMNQVLPKPNQTELDQVLDWKTARYSFLNPLHVGMVLANADDIATGAIAPYAVHAGRAFQITDDILGIFGEQSKSGKSSMDDIREGKYTVLIHYALQHATDSDRAMLQACLGDHDLTRTKFETCRTIIKCSGALEHAEQLAEQEVKKALQALDQQSWRWHTESVKFLRGLAQFILERRS